MFEFTASSRESVRRFFRDAFCAADIAEALVSYDGEREAPIIRVRMEAREFDVVGVRLGGLPVGYAMVSELESGRCNEHLRVFRDNECLPEVASITDVLRVLSDADRVFVMSLGTVHGIITREDVQKPPVRLWLFGLLTLLETTFATMIRDKFGDGSWREMISEGRLGRAKRLRSERLKRGDNVDLLDCLHFSDKADIVLRDEEMRAGFGFQSRKEAREATNEAERLRNSLAHSHDIVHKSWLTIVNFATHVDEIIDVYEQRHLTPKVTRAMQKHIKNR